MKLVDLNILIYAVRAGAPQHAAVAAWWEESLSGEESIGLPWAVIVGFLRIATNPRAVGNPMTVDEACAFVESWLEKPNVFIPTESEVHMAVLKELLSDVGLGGDLVPDAHLAALAISHGAVLYSCDNDFVRFPKLRWKNPLLPSHR